MTETPGTAFRRAAALAAALAALGAFVAAVAAEIAEAGSPADRLGASTLLSSTMFGLLALAGAFLTRCSVSEALGLAPGRLPARDVVILALGALGLSHLSDALLGWLGLLDDSILGELIAIIDGARGTTLAILLVGIAVGPGVAEELLCRGLLQRGVQRRFGAAAGVLVSSVVFAGIHLDLAQSLLALGVGLYLGATALATGSTRAGIGAHILNNAVAVCTAAAGLASAAFSPMWLNTLALLALGAGLRILYRELRS